jgi:hypothetical protein
MRMLFGYKLQKGILAQAPAMLGGEIVRGQTRHFDARVSMTVFRRP